MLFFFYFVILYLGDIMAYIKGLFIQEIFSNPSNGYMVGLMRVKEASDVSQVGKVVTFTGIFNELKYKMQYKLMGELVSHSKYGMQFQVNSYEVIMPTEEEEIIDFLSSEIFPIGEKTAEKIVKKLGKDTINKIISEIFFTVSCSCNSFYFIFVIFI